MYILDKVTLKKKSLISACSAVFEVFKLKVSVLEHVHTRYSDKSTFQKSVSSCVYILDKVIALVHLHTKNSHYINHVHLNQTKLNNFSEWCLEGYTARDNKVKPTKRAACEHPVNPLHRRQNGCTWYSVWMFSLV